MRKRIPQPASVVAAAVVVASLAVRIYFALRCSALPEYSDMGYYNDVALTPGFPTTLPPAYPLFLRAVYAIFGVRNYAAVFVVQSVLSSLTVYLMYRVARTVGTNAAGIAAAAIAAVYPNFILYNLTTLTETWSLLILLALFAVLAASVPETRRSILAVMLLVLGFLFKPVMLFFLPGAWLAVRKKAVFAAAAAVLFVPLALYEVFIGETFFRAASTFHKAYHDPTPGAAAPDDSSQAEEGDERLPGAPYLRTGWRYVVDQRARALERIHEKSTILVSRGWDQWVLRPIAGEGKWTRFLMDYAYVPVMVLGFVGMARRYGPRNRMIALPAIGYVLLVLVFSIFKFRYRLLLEPVLVVYAALLLFPPKRESAVLPRS
jgi:4-amino-4-deoxy-L-arabinose transferase-like glycosyltransferase